MAFLIFSLSFVNLAYAADTPSPTPTMPNGTWYNQSFQQWFAKVNNAPETEIFGERYTAAQVQWVIYGLFYFLITGGGGGNKLLEDLMNNDLTNFFKDIEPLIPKKTSFAPKPQGSIFATIFREDRPLSGITYVRETARNLHLIPRAQAQQTNPSAGFGFNALDPVLNLWRASRNIAYVFFVIIIVAMAFMIMFRVKISPQAVITVQSALPKIAIALILITFSYAIAGFMVDLMYIVIGLISVIIASTGALFTQSPLTMFNFLTMGAVTLGTASTNVAIPIGIFGILIFYGFFFMAILFLVLVAGTGLIGTVAASTALSTIMFLAGPLGAILEVIAFIILFVVFVVTLFKILWLLIKTFANVLLLVIFAPFQIAIGAITSATGFGAWLKSFASNLAVFPTIGLLIALSWVFLFQAARMALARFNAPQSILDFFKDVLGSNPNISAAWPPMLGSGETFASVLLVGVSLAIMMILPKVVELIQSFMTGKPFAFGTAIGEAVAPAAGAWGATGGKLVGAGREFVTPQIQYKLFEKLPESIKTTEFGKNIETLLAKKAGKIPS